MRPLLAIGFAIGYVGATKYGKRGLDCSPRELAENAVANLGARAMPVAEHALFRLRGRRTYNSWVASLPEVTQRKEA